MAIDSKTLLQLREMSGAGIVDAKKALEEANGDLASAVELLRKRGLSKAAGKADRVTAEGLIHAYIHGNGKVASMVELLCETDFVARTEQFKELAHDLAMHVAAANPLYVRPEEIPADVLDKEREIYAEELRGAGKPPEMIEKIVEGKLQKYYSETCLLKQAFIKDEDITVVDRLKHAISQLGENIQLRRFVRMNLGG